MMSKLTVAEWQTRLETTFLSPANELQAVRRQEGTAAEELRSELRGHWALADAFHEFFGATLRRALSSNRNAVGGREWWLFFLEFLTAFRNWRAAERIFRNGYPLAGFVLLRDLKDRAIVLCGVGREIATLHRALGHEAAEGQASEIMEEVKELRKREEWRIRDLILGTKSGLSQTTIKELRDWQEMFHTEVHGARLSQTDFLPFLKGEQPLQFGPQLRELSGATYTNRAAEVGWMWTTLFPLLQVEEGFGNQWSSEWQVLEDSFRYMVETLKELEKPGLNALVDAISELMEEKFTFDTETRFHAS